MLQNYIKTACRNLWSHKFFSVIHIMGLAMATATFLLLINFVKFEYSYEDFHEKANDIYRVTLDLYQGAELVDTDCETYPPLGPLLKKDMPEVVDYVRIGGYDKLAEMSYQNQVFRIGRTFVADPSLFTVFNHQFIKGDPSTALNEPMQVVLTETTAKRLFGTADPRGKTLKHDDWLFTVTGVIKDVPLNTHLKFDMAVSFSSLEKMGENVNTWNNALNYTYVQLRQHTNLKAFNKKLSTLSEERLSSETLVAEPIKDIHLYSKKNFEPEVNGDVKTVRFMLAIAILILLVGSVNYVNLTTARSAERIKEVGLRKILGSTRGLLMKQLMAETLLINVMAMGMALLIIWATFPFYEQLVGHSLDTNLFNSPTFWGMCLGLICLNSMLSGLYPAFSLSGTKPSAVTHRTFTGSKRSQIFRQGLVTGQFAVALIVLSASVVVYKQLAYLRSQDIGLNTAEVLTIPAPTTGADSLRRSQRQAFKNELLQLADVEAVTVSGSLPGLSLHELASMTGLTRYGSDEGEGYAYYLYGIDADFVFTMGMTMAAGRNFVSGAPNRDEVIVSEEAARLLGFKGPEEAVGAKISLSFSQEYSTIIGVVNSYHQQSLKESLLPMVHWYQEGGSFYSVKIHTARMRETLADVKRCWESVYPNHPFDYHFLDELFDRQYKADERFGKIAGVFSLFTLFITSLGLLGLTAYSVRRRAKEIGIRKVLGATVSGIVRLLSKDFVKLACLAIVIGSPLAWWAMSSWLDDFAYRIELQWWMFAAPGVIAIAVVLLTVSLQAIKAATANPVDSLRDE